jgi:hypothetical protein
MSISFLIIKIEGLRTVCKVGGGMLKRKTTLKTTIPVGKKCFSKICFEIYSFG